MPTYLSIRGNLQMTEKEMLLDKIGQCHRPSGTRGQSVDLIVRDLRRGGRV